MSNCKSTQVYNRGMNPNMTLYTTDGRGRDTYIHYNNGGFWKEYTIQIQNSETFDTQRNKSLRSLK